MKAIFVTVFIAANCCHHYYYHYYYIITTIADVTHIPLTCETIYIYQLSLHATPHYWLIPLTICLLFYQSASRVRVCFIHLFSPMINTC